MTDIPFREKVLCSVNEAAAAISVSRAKLYLLIRSGRLRTVRIDDRTKVVVASLLELGGDQRVAASALETA